ncbi:MAG TPA: hypothetical protein VFM88_11675 [Vicinamibacteria bacterium]|nr:hypothetical protein [Vicinamibacteria bacterium]
MTLYRSTDAAGLPLVAAALPMQAAHRDRMWEHCRNALGIARLLVHEGRPTALVDTACRMAVEAACRAALERAGFEFDGDLERSLDRLSAPHDLLAGMEDGSPPARLAACEHALGFLAGYLRSEAPERSWTF